MRRHEIENWALSVVERVENRQPIEDISVELKSSWPEAQKAARQIAGHGNAARGEPFLWLIGIDEKKGVITGADQTELANWYPAVKSQFDGLAPNVIDLNIPVKGATIVALLFESDRAPFVVKNPTGGHIQFEVPWRENRSTRSASRSDLIKILSPLQKLPSIEVLNSRLIVRPAENQGVNYKDFSWWFFLDFYVVLKNENRIVIPFHRCEVSFEVSEILSQTFFNWIDLGTPERFSGDINAGMVSKSFTIKKTSDEVLIDGPGKLELKASAKTQAIDGKLEGVAQVAVHLFPADAEHSIPINVILKSSPPGEDLLGSWILE